MLERYRTMYGAVAGPSGVERYLMVGPFWSSDVPNGFTHVVFHMALMRRGVASDADVANVRRLQQGYAVSPLHEVVTGVTPVPVERLEFPRFNQREARSGGVVPYVNLLRGQLKLHPSETSLIGRFAAIGINPNQPFAPSGETRAAIDRGVAATLEEIAAGSPLDGGMGKYVLRFRRGQTPPAGAFWSVTMYDRDGFLVPNSAERYAIGDRTLGLAVDADGSLTIYLRPTSPGASAESNWLPSPVGSFSLVLRRLYLSESGAKDHYAPPGVMPVQ
jgi:hypothetical protein